MPSVHVYVCAIIMCICHNFTFISDSFMKISEPNWQRMFVALKQFSVKKLSSF